MISVSLYCSYNVLPAHVATVFTRHMRSATVKVVAVLLAGVLALSSTTEVRAESNVEWKLEDELINEGDIDENDEEANQIIEGILTDEEYLSSENIMVQELMEELSEEYYENIWDEVDESKWCVSSHDHEKIVDYAVTGTSNKDKARYKKCLVFGANHADDKLLHDRGNNKIQLHAMDRNYVLYLNILWKYSKLIVSKKGDRKAVKDTIKEYTGKLSLDHNDREDVNSLLNTIPLIFNIYQSREHAPSVIEQKYLVMGLALHLIGDIFAHRTLVPGWWANTLSPSDFKSNEKYNEFMALVNIRSISTHSIEVYTKNDKNTDYEDNPNVIPQRMSCSKKTALEFVQQIQKSGMSFSSSFIKNDPGSDIYLENFIAYASQAGV